MGRSWVSVPLGKSGIRVGRSVADYELRPKLPSWRRYELRENLQNAAAARGKPHMTKERANYIIDRAFAHGELDAAGNPTIKVRGSDEGELARDIVDKSAQWGATVTHDQALVTAREAIRKIEFRRSLPGWLLLIAAAAIAIALMAVNAAKADDTQYGFVQAPGNYDAEFERNAARCPEPWRPYAPGYNRCSGDDHREEGEAR